MTPKPRTAAEHVLAAIRADVTRLSTAVGNSTVLGTSMDHLALDRRGPNGHAYDTQATGRTELWCWTHQQRAGDTDRGGCGCDGEAIQINDPTGEAALHPDRASDTRAQIAGDLEKARRLIAGVMRKVEMTTTTTTGNLLSLGDDTRADPGCESCARVNAPSGKGRYWSPPHGGRSTLDGALPEPGMLLCKTCRRDVLDPDVRRLPSKAELETRRDGGRVRRKVAS